VSDGPTVGKRGTPRDGTASVACCILLLFLHCPTCVLRTRIIAGEELFRFVSLCVSFAFPLARSCCIQNLTCVVGRTFLSSHPELHNKREPLRLPSCRSNSERLMIGWQEALPLLCAVRRSESKTMNINHCAARTALHRTAFHVFSRTTAALHVEEGSARSFLHATSRRSSRGSSTIGWQSSHLSSRLQHLVLTQSPAAATEEERKKGERGGAASSGHGVQIQV
jgi:hypothetical protein